MQQVITAEQALEITKGRPPLTMEAYEVAVAKLRECLTIEDAKYFANFADAAATWAKIKHDERVLRLARKLKVEAGERCARLAIKEHPKVPVYDKKGRVNGMIGGPQRALIDNGFTMAEARGALRVARMTAEERAALDALPRPPALSNVRHARLDGRNDPRWQEIRHWLVALRGQISKTNPQEMAFSIPSTGAGTARLLALEIIEWLDEFERALPKEKR